MKSLAVDITPPGMKHGVKSSLLTSSIRVERIGVYTLDTLLNRGVAEAMPLFFYTVLLDAKN